MQNQAFRDPVHVSEGEDDSQFSWKKGESLFSDDFADMSQWSAELENGGTVQAEGGRLVIDVPRGCTVWYRPLISGPVMITYEANVVDEGGVNDRVSDLNCLWMARDTRSPDDVFGTSRSGKFSDYNQLEAYYVGLGANNNTTTRFRRYIGDPVVRPMLPQHDLTEPRYMIEPNRWQRIRLVAYDGLIQYFRDDDLIFSFEDGDPYTSGWFGLRTVANHMEIRDFRVVRLEERVEARP